MSNKINTLSYITSSPHAMYRDPEKKEHWIVGAYRKTPIAVRMLVCAIVILLVVLAVILVWKLFKGNSDGVPSETSKLPDIDPSQTATREAAPTSPSQRSMLSADELREIQDQIVNFTNSYVR